MATSTQARPETAKPSGLRGWLLSGLAEHAQHMPGPASELRGQDGCGKWKGFPGFLAGAAGGLCS